MVVTDDRPFCDLTSYYELLSHLFGTEAFDTLIEAIWLLCNNIITLDCSKIYTSS